MPVAEMRVARVGTLREAVHLRAIGLVEVGETKGVVAKKPSVNGTTVYLWWKRFCDENPWQTINAPAGRVLCSSKIACTKTVDKFVSLLYFVVLVLVTTKTALNSINN